MLLPKHYCVSVLFWTITIGTRNSRRVWSHTQELAGGRGGLFFFFAFALLSDHSEDCLWLIVPHLRRHPCLFVCCGIYFWSCGNESVLVNGCRLLKVTFSTAVTALTDRPAPHKKTTGLKLAERKQMLVLREEPEFGRTHGPFSEVVFLLFYCSPLLKRKTTHWDRDLFYKGVAVFGISARPYASKKTKTIQNASERFQPLLAPWWPRLPRQ